MYNPSNIGNMISHCISVGGKKYRKKWIFEERGQFYLIVFLNFKEKNETLRCQVSDFTLFQVGKKKCCKIVNIGLRWRCGRLSCVRRMRYNLLFFFFPYKCWSHHCRCQLLPSMKTYLLLLWKKKDFFITFLIFVVNSFILCSISKLSCGCRRVPKREDQEISKDTWSSANNSEEEKTVILVM